MTLVVERWQARTDSRAIGLDAYRKRAGRSGRHLMWTEEEDAIVRRLHPNVSATCAALKQKRSKEAVYRRGIALLGPKRKARFWTGAEEARLKKVYASATRQQLLDQFPGRTIGGIQLHALQMGITGKRGRAWKEIGHALIDQISRRAKELGYLKWELLAEVGFLKKPRQVRHFSWRQFGRTWKRLLHMVAFLEGTVTIEWRPAT